MRGSGEKGQQEGTKRGAAGTMEKSEIRRRWRGRRIGLAKEESKKEKADVSSSLRGRFPEPLFRLSLLPQVHLTHFVLSSLSSISYYLFASKSRYYMGGAISQRNELCWRASTSTASFFIPLLGSLSDGIDHLVYVHTQSTNTHLLPYPTDLPPPPQTHRQGPSRHMHIPSLGDHGPFHDDRRQQRLFFLLVHRWAGHSSSPSSSSSSRRWWWWSCPYFFFCDQCYFYAGFSHRDCPCCHGSLHPRSGTSVYLDVRGIFHARTVFRVWFCAGGAG